MKSTFLLGTLISLFFCSVSALSPQDTQNRALKQQIHNHLTDIPDFFFRPLEYSDTSFSFFLKRIYNHRKYPQGFLALNFLHVLSGVNLAPQAEQPRRYIAKLFYLFDRKMQGIYVNPYAFFDLLHSLPSAVAPFCNRAKEKKDKVKEIKECVCAYIVDNFQNFKAQPEKTLNTLADRLYDLTASSDEKDISIKELQHSLHYFLGRALSHLVWSPSDQADTWQLVKKISCALEKCSEYSMLDEEMLDDLFWTLLQRYAFFIDLCASDLMQPFFDIVYNDLKTERAALWLAPEREELITTKQAYIHSVLMEAEIKSRASSTALAINAMN